VSRHVGTGLARVTIAAPNRRIDVALPEHVAPAELLPALLRHAGDDLADSGQQHGGWVLRRADGSALDAGRALGAQSVRDGEVLHLVPRRTEWPELDYDDVVDAIAAGARRQGQAWTGATTRACGLAVAGVVLGLGLLAILGSGPGWLVPGIVALGVAITLTVTGAVLSRGLSDSVAGAVLAALALPYAFSGGALVAGGDRELGEFGAPHLLAASAVLLVVSLLAYLAVADRTQVFVAGATAGLLGGAGALLAFTGVDGAGAAAIVVSVALALVPALPLLAIRMGKLPMPALPASAEELVRAEPMPPRSKVYASVVRSDELLTGMLIGAALVSAVGQVLLIRSGSVAGAVLVGVVAAASLLRARSFPTVRLRTPLLVTGLVGLTALVLGPTFDSTVVRLTVVVPALALAAAFTAAAGLAYSRRAPSPYLGRIADILDVLLVIAVVPVACGVLGLYGYARGIAG
jgi:type VII secretion integral membrane protein EccD